jgi:pSer/pThr/pTyr-binding forkhead associated (FHA) protein
MAKLHHPHAGLLLVRDKRQVMIPLTKAVTTIGRKLADIILDDAKVSSTHAEVRIDGSEFLLKDLESTNGTFVNRKQVQEVILVDQDVIEVGSSTFCFYQDLREFNGQAEETTAGHRVKEVLSEKTVDGVTTTKTIAQPVIELEVMEGPGKGKRYRFKKTHITIGRNDADMVLLDIDVSRQHAMIEVLGVNTIFLRDMGSTNGTILKGKKVQSEKISDGAEFIVGGTTIRISVEAV